MDSYVPTFQAEGGSDGDAGKRQQVTSGSRFLQAEWRVLSGVNWWRSGKAGTRIHQKGGNSGIPRAWYGSGMKIEVENFPAFIVMDDKGNDFFDIG